jgi:hypothetical protein
MKLLRIALVSVSFHIALKGYSEYELYIVTDLKVPLTSGTVAGA